MVVSAPRGRGSRAELGEGASTSALTARIATSANNARRLMVFLPGLRSLRGKLVYVFGPSAIFGFTISPIVGPQKGSISAMGQGP